MDEPYWDDGYDEAPPDDVFDTASHTSTPPAEEPVALAPADQPTHYWTWRLLAAGLNPEECAAARAIELQTVFDHALRAAGDGWEVQADWFLSAELIAACEQIIGNAPPKRIRPLLSKLPIGTRYEQVQYYLASLGSENAGATD